MNNISLTHRQRRSCMSGRLMSISRWHRKAKVAKWELSVADKEDNEACTHVKRRFSYNTVFLLTNWHSPLNAFRYSGEDTSDTAALTRYLEHLEALANAYIDALCEMTGCGYFDFNDWWATVFTGAEDMVRFERDEQRLHQSAYARKRVAATVMKQINQGKHDLQSAQLRILPASVPCNNTLRPPQGSRWNYAYTIAFEVITEHAAEEVSEDELFEGLLRRFKDLRNCPGEILEACGLPYDAYEMQEGE